MRVIETTALEDCFDQGLIKEFVLDGAMDELTMQRLAAGGQIDYHPEFPRPYFRVERPGGVVIQGVVGRSTFRVTFSNRAAREREAQITEIIEAQEDQEH